MKTRRSLFSESLVLISFLFALSAFAAEGRRQSPNYSWLNGRWVGQSAIGGEIELTLQVVNGNQIKGWGRLRRARRPIRTIVTGTVSEGEVKLVSYNPFFGITTQFLLSLLNGVLTGRSFSSPDDAEGVEVTFTKLD